MSGAATVAARQLTPVAAAPTIAAPMRPRVLVLTVLPLLSISCQLVFGVDDPPSASPSGEGGEGAATSGTGASTGADGGAAVSSSSGPPQCEVCLDVPPDWNGPVLHVAAPGKAEPTCPNAAVAVFAYEGVPEPHSCSACGCGAPSGSCGAATFQCWSAANCAGNVVTSTNADDCLPVLFSGNTAASCSVDPAPVPSGGSCPAVVGQVQGASWQKTHGLCPLSAAMGGSCESGSCYDAGGDDAAELCVWSSSGAACPAGWDTRYDAWDHEDDERGCSCTCSATGEACSGGGYAFGPIIAVCPTTVGPNACANNVAAGKKLDYAYTATCLPGPSEPIGAFTPSGPVAICCRPAPAG